MKYISLLLLVSAVVATADRQHESSLDVRDEKFFSLFSIVSFPNDVCSATSGDNGTCVSSSECSKDGGSAQGTCASSFGVCCVFSATCDESSSKNNTYFQNPGYASAYKDAGNCVFTVTKSSSDVCQLRLNFDEFDIEGPEADIAVPAAFGSCDKDQFLATGSPSGAFGPICGVNTGQHAYMDAPSGGGQSQLRMIISNTDTERKWKIKVIHVPCSDAAPSGCMQYFTGVSGIIQSFNFQIESNLATGVHLQNQNQVICIRPEPGFCKIEYNYNPDLDSINSFGIYITTTANMAEGLVTCIKPEADYIVIPAGTDAADIKADRFCGEALGSGTDTGMMAAGMPPITSDVRLFSVTFKSNDAETSDEVPTTAFATKGFSLKFTQQPCTSK